MKRKDYAALVVGAGIAGIRSALDLAEAGHKVALIDRRPGIGGILTQLDHQFPSDHCGMCKMLPLTERDSSSQFCLRKGLFHDNIDILLSTELTSLEGDPGKFKATLSERSTFVDPERCISCGECSKACPVEVPSEFNAGLTTRPAIHLPIPHAIPNHYVVDMENCKRCWQCVEACPTGAVDFHFEERKDFHILVVHEDAEVGAFVSKVLDEQNFPLHVAATGQEALDILDSVEGLRLLLVGAALPDMDSEKVVRRAREAHPDLDAVVLAPDQEQDAAHALREAGASEILETPLGKGFMPWLDKHYVRTVSDTRHELEVGAVVLAGGFSCHDPSDTAGTLGYGAIPGVVTSVEFERMCSGTGPGGGILGPSGPPKKIAWLQCVGSRDIQRHANYCSSICCMYAIKEALMAKRMLGSAVETSIFYMDMRAFGKDYHRYRDKAEHEQGVRFIPSRIHTVLPLADDPGLSIQYYEDGELKIETYDMLVLSVGARPPKGTELLAEATGIELDEHGFCSAQPYQPARTSRLGVYAAGAFGQPRDIAESVVQASAAALGASRTVELFSPPREEAALPDPEYRDVSREAPQTMVVICSSCPTLENTIDMQAMEGAVANLPSVKWVLKIEGACAPEGWEQIETLAQEHLPNRILIGACMPYAYVPKLRELGRKIALDPAFMDVVDIYTPSFPGRMESADHLSRETFANLSMAAMKLAGAEPSPTIGLTPVTHRAMVVGGGLAGMTAAMSVADHGHEVCLVERGSELGGLSMKLAYNLDGTDPARHMAELIEEVEKHPHIRVFKDSRVLLSMGRAGRYMSAIAQDGGPALTLEHGATILATGGREAVPDSYGYHVHKTVLVQSELESGLADGSLDTGSLTGVAMIQCVESREKPRNYCSRVCCTTALKNALILKERNPELPVFIFYRDIMAYGFAEKYYTEARRKGVIFIRYKVDAKPEVTFDADHRPTIRAYDPILNRDVEFTTDLLVLSVGIDPNAADTLSEVFGVELNHDGFFQEAEAKWRPVEFLRQGLFVCGLAHSPRNMNETIAQAQAAAQKVVRILAKDTIQGSRVTATVRHSLCSLCGRCVEVCPFEARTLDMELGQVVVDDVLCQGCGSCAAVCPNSASVLSGFRDGQILSVIDAALTEYKPESDVQRITMKDSDKTTEEA